MAKPAFTLFAFPSVWAPHAPCTCHFAGLRQQGPGQTRPPCRARGICVAEVTRPVGGVEARVGAATHGTHVRVCALACAHPSRALVPVCRGLPGWHVVDVQRTRPVSAGWQRGAQARVGSRSHSCVVTRCVRHRSSAGEKVTKLSCHRPRLSVAPRPREPPSRPVKEGAGKALGDGNPQAIFRGHKCRKGTPILGGRLPPMGRRPSGRVVTVPCGGG